MQTLIHWQSVSEPPPLQKDELHLWRTPLRDTNLSTELLDANERKQAERFTDPAGKRNFIVMRTLLRKLLSRYLHTNTEQFSFEVNKHGKPKLRGGELCFNMSHSGDMGLIAIAKDSEVGVDIERVNSHRATTDIASRFFSAAEINALSHYTGEEKVRAFFRCWSRKEAVIKALGEGLTCSLSSFDVNLLEDNAALVAFRRDDVVIDNWSLSNIHAAEGYEAAAAVIGPCANVLGFELCEY